MNKLGKRQSMIWFYDKVLTGVDFLYLSIMIQPPFTDNPGLSHHRVMIQFTLNWHTQFLCNLSQKKMNTYNKVFFSKLMYKNTVNDKKANKL